MLKAKGAPLKRLSASKRDDHSPQGIYLSAMQSVLINRALENLR